MKTTLSLTIEENLLNALKEKAAGDNETVNVIVEKLLEEYFFSNKYKLKRKVQNLYNEHIGGAGNITFSPKEYIVTNGLDFMIVDDIKDVQVEKNDYVFKCRVIDWNVDIKLVKNP